MSIEIKVPPLPDSSPEARVGRWEKAAGAVVGSGELLGYLLLQSDDTIIPLVAPQAGRLKLIFYSEGEIVTVGAVLAQLETDSPTYRAEGVTTSMEYELRQMIRQGEAKFGQGFGSGLALPQVQNTRPEQGMGGEFQQQRRFKVNPLLRESSQFAGDFKNPAVIAEPANAAKAPALQHILGAKPQPGPTPTPRPQR